MLYVKEPPACFVLWFDTVTFIGYYANNVNDGGNFRNSNGNSSSKNQDEKKKTR